MIGQATAAVCGLAVAYIVGVGHGVRLGYTWWNRMRRWADTTTRQEETWVR